MEKLANLRLLLSSQERHREETLRGRVHGQRHIREAQRQARAAARVRVMMMAGTVGSLVVVVFIAVFVMSLGRVRVGESGMPVMIMVAGNFVHSLAGRDRG